MPGQISLITLLATSSQTTQGSSTPFDCTGWASLEVMASIISGTPTAGSVSTFRVWLQGQINPGGVWSDLILKEATKTFAGANLAAAAGVSTNGSPSLVAEVVGQSSVVNFYGRLGAPPPLVRVAWNLVAVSGAPFVNFGVEGFLSQIPTP